MCYAQVQSYYIQLVHGINNLLGSEHSLDLSNLPVIHLAMQKYWHTVRLLLDYPCLAAARFGGLD